LESNAPPLLSAAWRHLVLRNHIVDPALLAPFVPAGCELDPFAGEHWISLVGFLFEDLAVHGVRIPFHRRFEEVNLRFYVRHNAPDGPRRGVVFVRELAASTLISWAAKAIYNEPYLALPMDHELERVDGEVTRARYTWQHGAVPGELGATLAGPLAPLRHGSLEEFLVEHYWGYNLQPDGGTLEYAVEHPPWRVAPTHPAVFAGDAETLYGAQFAAVLAREPDASVFAEGSAIGVHAGRPIADHGEPPSSSRGFGAHG